MKLPGWVVVYARAASILTLLFALTGVMLMIAGAPQTPFSWPTFWETVALMLIASSVFVWSTAPLEAPATAADSHDVASTQAEAHANPQRDAAAAISAPVAATSAGAVAAKPAQTDLLAATTIDRVRNGATGASVRSAAPVNAARSARPRP